MKRIASVLDPRWLAAIVFTFMLGAATAQEAPLRILVGFPPGGVTDVVARVLAQGLQSELGRTVVVENRPGAGGQIAGQALRASSPDGSTVFLTLSHTTAMVPLTVKSPGFDPARDFVNVGLIATMPNFFMVNPALVGPEVNSFEGFVKWVKDHPGQGNIGVPAPASAPEFSVVVLGDAFKVELRAAPYRGDAPLIQDLIAGQVPAGIAGVAAALPYIQNGKLKLLAVDGPQRLAGFDVPTYAELGVSSLKDVIFMGLVAPAGIPADQVLKLNAAMNKVVNASSFMSRLQQTGIQPKTGTPEDMTRLTEASRTSNAALVKAAKFQPQ